MAILNFDRFKVSKNPIFHYSSSSNDAFCVTDADRSLSCKFDLNTAISKFWTICGHQKSDFSELVPGTSKGAFSVSYFESSLTCKFELNRAILDFGQFEVRKNKIFHNSSLGPQMVRIVLVTRTAD